MCLDPQAYDLAATKTYNQIHPLLIVISGPSGAGKDAVVKRLIEKHPSLHFVVTATSRPPRPGEVEGRDYFFLSKIKFEQMIAQNELLEHTLVYQDYKGIPKAQIRRAMESGKDVILRLDVQGAATVRTLCPDSILVFISPPSEADLIERLRNRNSESVENLKIRLDEARRELGHLDEFDYLVVNQDGHLDEAADAIITIIKTEHMRVHPRKISL